MNRRLALAAALVAAASLPGHAAEKRAFTIADLYRVEGVSEPAVALDGRSVAFVVTTTDLPKIERHSRVWRVDADGSNPRALTATEGRDWSPAFSPDGTVLAFLSSRAGAPQVFFLPTAGGEAEKKTDFPGGVGAFLFAPDGRRLVFTAEVWPDCGADAACNRRKDETVEQGKMKVHVADHLLFRHWDAWEDGKRAHLIVQDLADAKAALRDLTPGDFDSPAFSVGGGTDFDVSPDGEEVVFTSNRDPQPATSTGRNQALLDEVDFRPMEEIFVDSPTGRIQVLLVKPHGFDPARKYPVIVNVHGGPQMQWADAFRGDAQVYPGAGYVVAFPNPHGSTGWGQAFTASISRDWDGKVMKDVMAVTDWLAAQPWVDRDRMGAMGWSWGGYAMMWLAGHTDRFKALATMMGVYDLRTMYSATEELWFPEWDLGGTPWQSPELYRRQSPSSSVTRFKTPTLVLTGEKDFRIPYTQSLAFFTDLQKMGVPSRLVVFSESGHWPGWYDMVLYYAAHLDWFHRSLGGEASPWDPLALAGNTVFGARAAAKEDSKP